MGGLGAQGKRKRDVRAVDMSIVEDDGPTWSPPPDEACEELAYETTPPGAKPEEDRIKVRIVSDRETFEMVRFALVQQTCLHGKWVDVVVVDCAHGDDVHLHRYGRRSPGDRIGDAEQLMVINGVADVQTGYSLAVERVIDVWAENKRRWHDG